MKIPRLGMKAAALVTVSGGLFVLVSLGGLRFGHPIVKEGPSVRVLAELDVVASAEADLDDEGQVEAQRRRIAERATELRGMLEGTGIEVVRTYATVPFIALRVSGDVRDRLDRLPGIRRWHPVRAYRPSLFESLWVVEALEAWNRGITGQGKAIAIVDTGVDATQPFFGDRVIEEACFASGYRDLQEDLPEGVVLDPDAVDPDWFSCPDGSLSQVGPGAAAPCDYYTCEHGTHVAGVAAGLGASGILGMAPMADIVAVQVAEPVVIAAGLATGIGPNLTEDNVLAALEWLYLERDRLDLAAVNLSFGGDPHDNLPFAEHDVVSGVCDGISSLDAVIHNLTAAGVAVVAAAGNDGLDDALQFPSCMSEVISVGSSTFDDTLSTFSNVAPSLDLLAPGQGYETATPVGADTIGFVEPCSTDPDHHWGICSSIPGTSGAQRAGTSVSAAHVAGAIALLKQQYPSASVAALRRHLRRTGRRIPAPTGAYSIPRIDLNRATDCPLGSWCFYIDVPELPIRLSR